MTSPYMMDHRLLRRRAKTIRELKPAFLFDAHHGIDVADGAVVASWGSVVSDDALVQASDGVQPTFVLNGLGNQPCVLFDGTTWLSASKSLLSGTTASVLVVAEFLPYEGEIFQSIIAFGRAALDDYYWMLRTRALPHISAASRNNDTETGFNANGTEVFDNGMHVVLLQSNAAGDGYELEIDGVSQVLTPFAGGALARGPGNITDMDYTTVGAWEKEGGRTNYLSAKISLLAGWNHRI